jgi:hypothetical protein
METFRVRVVSYPAIQAIEEKGVHVVGYNSHGSPHLPLFATVKGTVEQMQQLQEAQLIRTYEPHSKYARPLKTDPSST